MEELIFGIYGNLHMNACAQGFALIKRFGVTQKSATSHVKIQTCPSK